MTQASAAQAAADPVSSRSRDTSSAPRQVRVAVDAMGGDAGPEAVVDAVLSVARDAPGARFTLFGDGPALEGFLAARAPSTDAAAGTEPRVRVVHCAVAIDMADSPRDAIRRGPDASMRRALAAVADGDADAIVSAGNTAALTTLASLILARSPGVDRPAIAALWPQTPSAADRSGAGERFSVVLDMGASLQADAAALVQFAAMGAEYARLALGPQLDGAPPRVALLNVGAEPTKGRPELREAARILESGASDLGVRFVGFIEGDTILSGRADVVVTDGFTGNVALKSAEGAARLIGAFIREAFSDSWIGRAAALAAAPALKRLKRRMDPRRVNGGVFLGLQGVVVKSHGSADAVAFGSALRLAARLATSDAARRFAAQVALLGDAPVHQEAMGSVRAGRGARPRA